MKLVLRSTRDKVKFLKIYYDDEITVSTVQTLSVNWSDLELFPKLSNYYYIIIAGFNYEKILW